MIIFDSGCSVNMSGVKDYHGFPGRLVETEGCDVKIRGFDGMMQETKMIGRNEDGKKELFVEGMPQNLVLLSAKQYAEDGAAVLFGEEGMVLRLKEDEKKELREHVMNLDVIKYLEVCNSTYRVAWEKEKQEEAFAANTFFNTKVNVSNGEERILAYMLCGLTWEMMWEAIDKGSVRGIHPDINKPLLSQFSRKWGKTPDFLQMAHPNKTGNEKGYLSVREEVSEIGNVQVDFMQWDFNEKVVDELPSESIQSKKRKKLKTFGGAVAGALAVDEKTRYCSGWLLKSVAKPLDLVMEIFGEYKKFGHEIKSVAADAGVSGSSDFRVYTPAVDHYLNKCGCRIVKADPNNHSNGTPLVERMIQSIKVRMRMAFQYAFHNPNLQRLGFTKVQLMMLWGEIFYWAIEIENLRSCGVDNTKTRQEVFRNQVPDIQNTRLLPIFSVLKVHRERTNAEREGGVIGAFYQYGLYTGPCPFGKGVVRVAILIGGKTYILRTSKYKGVSDGGDALQYTHIEAGIERVISDHDELELDENEVHQVTGEEVLETETKIQNGAASGERVVTTHKHDTRHQKKLSEEIDACFVSWCDFWDGESYFDCHTGGVLTIGEEPRISECFMAMSEGVPRSLREALKDPRWGEPARNELHTLTNQMRTLVPITKDDAIKAVQEGADKVVLFPVYEKKVKEGKEVFKVRLVCNGKTQYGAGQTYSPTPTRVEMYILFQLAATLDWELVHLDETRAFLSSEYKGTVPVVASIGGVPGMWSVKGALYGLRTSPRHYREEVLKRLAEMGFVPMEKCMCIFLKGSVIVFEFVDDFIISGPIKEEVVSAIGEYRSRAVTTEPIWDPINILGHEIKRDRDRRKMELGIRGKIEDLVNHYGEGRIKKRSTPMRKEQFIVKEEELNGLGEDGKDLDDDERREYQSVVGSMMWICGLRHDGSFAVNYLAGNGRSPKVHHRKVAEHLLGFLWKTSEVTLTLGGEKIEIIAYSDSSYGTGKNGRGVNGTMIKLNDSAGAVIAKSMISKYVRLSSFESELEALNTTIKMVKWVKFVAEGLLGQPIETKIFGDNQTMINFVHGEVEIKSSKHMEIKMYHAVEEYAKGTFEMRFMSGEMIPADVLTKVCTKERFQRFIGEVQGGCEKFECHEEDEDQNEGEYSLMERISTDQHLVAQVGGCVGGRSGVVL